MRRLLRLWGCRLRLRHGRPPDDGWGYAHGTGMIGVYCGGCGARYETIPLEDYEGMAEVLTEVWR